MNFRWKELIGLLLLVVGGMEGKSPLVAGSLMLLGGWLFWKED